ncbi:uncharacterized protein DUF998 [Georgenia soli]|uniref:Uncharacterized protein DUF998 n=1 Tax=Georgenia soli TaxID=638953 RepID=A0A2A9EQV9_9MICO|nr:DUF998 domain-containing protein [Georgenia soli]PFG40599.1 uncharacterized protein DUF998 [Georgenia soli]
MPPRTRAGSAATRALLGGGVVAGPFFVVMTAAQVASREGFDLRRHGLSLLSHGELGWLQVTAFVGTGLLVVACAAGVHRLPEDLGGGRLTAVRLAVAGPGLVLAGAFRVEPSGGFPPGAPAATAADARESLWHDVGTALAVNAAILACVVLARRLARAGRRARAAYCWTTAALTAVLAWWPGGGTSIRLAIVTVLTMTWVTVVAAWLRSDAANQRTAATATARKS